VNFIVLPLFVMLTTITMAALATPLGPLLTSAAPLRVYAIDIVGSMTGVALFTVLSALQTPPSVWFVVLAVLLGLSRLGTGVNTGAVVNGALIAGTILVSTGTAGVTTFWSPYYRITVHDGAARAISVNGIPHQAMASVDNPRLDPFYDQVYRWFPERTFGRVLIVGAGSGNDVAMALKHGAATVDAVEIDPRIQQIGVEGHPNRPYADPRVRPIVNDGRAFLRSATGQYDLVVFALPDSLTLVSTSANLRLESFLFTTEAFTSVRDHLAPGGVFVMYNYYRQPWLVEKLAVMLRDAFGHAPLIRTYDLSVGNGAALAAGPLVSALNGASPPGDAVDTLTSAENPPPATDDWPFLYLRAPSLPAHYLVALTVLLVWAATVVLRGASRARIPIRRFSPHFFVLGIAFLLLETRSLVTFSLLFGSTWLVNALVFFAILGSVLLAIGISARVTLSRPRLLYAALLVAIAIAWLLPPGNLLIEPVWLRYVVAATVAFAPVFLANLVFSFSFRDTQAADMAFASNLLGAMVGGAVEYLALISGYQALLVVLGALYVLAWVLASRFRLLADRDLMTTSPTSPGSQTPAPGPEPAAS
jgi:SAM-dependent methyltransferase